MTKWLTTRKRRQKLYTEESIIKVWNFSDNVSVMELGLKESESTEELMDGSVLLQKSGTAKRSRPVHLKEMESWVLLMIDHLKPSNIAT